VCESEQCRENSTENPDHSIKHSKNIKKIQPITKTPENVQIIHKKKIVHIV